MEWMSDVWCRMLFNTKQHESYIHTVMLSCSMSLTWLYFSTRAGSAILSVTELVNFVLSDDFSVLVVTSISGVLQIARCSLLETPVNEDWTKAVELGRGDLKLGCGLALLSTATKLWTLRGFDVESGLRLKMTVLTGRDLRWACVSDVTVCDSDGVGLGTGEEGMAFSRMFLAWDRSEFTDLTPLDSLSKFAVGVRDVEGELGVFGAEFVSKNCCRLKRLFRISSLLFAFASSVGLVLIKLFCIAPVDLAIVTLFRCCVWVLFFVIVLKVLLRLTVTGRVTPNICPVSVELGLPNLDLSEATEPLRLSNGKSSSYNEKAKN